MPRRSLWVAIALALGSSVLLASCQALNRQSPAVDQAKGRIVWPKDSDLWVYDLVARQQKKITNLPQSNAVTGVSWSPDGTRIVYSQFWRRPNENASGADLFLANADGSNARVFVQRETANGVVEAPQWAPSGQVYFTVRRTQAGRSRLSIARQAEGGQPETLIDGGYNPTISPDESSLVYLKETRLGQALMKKTLGQAGDGCELLSADVFQYLSQPRISPDGTRVALGGSGEANPGVSGCGGDNHPKPSALAPVLALATWLEPTVAYAHGAPADMYTLNMDGSNLIRVADIKDDDPTVAWSPDGTRLAIFGIGALYLVDSKGGPATKLADQGGYGGLDWTR